MPDEKNNVTFDKKPGCKVLEEGTAMQLKNTPWIVVIVYELSCLIMVLLIHSYFVLFELLIQVY